MFETLENPWKTQRTIKPVKLDLVPDDLTTAKAVQGQQCEDYVPRLVEMFPNKSG